MGIGEGRGRRWDKLGDWNGHIYTTMSKTENLVGTGSISQGTQVHAL